MVTDSLARAVPSASMVSTQETGSSTVVVTLTAASVGAPWSAPPQAASKISSRAGRTGRAGEFLIKTIALSSCGGFEHRRGTWFPSAQGHSRNAVVAAVAQRRPASPLAAAKPKRFRALGDMLQRNDGANLVRSIAERLAVAAPAGAPPVGFPGLDVDGIRTRPGNQRPVGCGIGHFRQPCTIPELASLTPGRAGGVCTRSCISSRIRSGHEPGRTEATDSPAATATPRQAGHAGAHSGR